MAGNSDQPGAAVADSYADVERIVFGVVMIAAPILMLGAAIFTPAARDRERRGLLQSLT